MTRKHEELDRSVTDLARRALLKKQAGGKLSRDEKRAIERVKQHEDEKLRWLHYATIPKAHYIELSGRQQKVLDDQHRRYGMPVNGKVIDLGQVLRWIHQLLADHGRKLLKPDDESDLLYGGDGSPALERYREEQYRLARLERRKREGKLADIQDVHEGLALIAAQIRELGEELGKKFGDDATDMVNARLDACERLIEAYFAGPDAAETTDNEES